MLDQEFMELMSRIHARKCEEQVVEIKSAHSGCPDKLYDTFSSFSNQDDGGTIVFSIDEKQNFKEVGVYDAQDLQKKLMEIGESMTPIVRPVLSVFDTNGLVFVTAEIPPVDITDRPCFKTAKGRLKGSYVRVGDADKPMTEYEVYSYEAFRRKYRDDIRPVGEATLGALNQNSLEEYLSLRRKNRPNLSYVDDKQLCELTGVTRNGEVTLSAVLLFSPYPQAYFPQLSIIAARVPGEEMGYLDSNGQRFSDSKRIEGTLIEMLDGAVNFVSGNMRTAIRIDPETGKRDDLPEYPMDAVREIILNALVHRDYSQHTENIPIQLTMFSDRMEIRNPGGLYGRMTLDQLGKMQPDTRNPFLVTAMETLRKTENRYSGIPRIRRAMAGAGLQEPLFKDFRGEFSVTLYNGRDLNSRNDSVHKNGDEKGILEFCSEPRTRKELVDFLGLASAQYALKRYVDPLVKSGQLTLSIPEKPKSPKQTYIATRSKK